MPSIETFSSEPALTIKTVQSRTGIKPVTLRAWERRYNLLNPVRMPNGYRLYSERDIQLLLWVQRKLDSGVSISQVVTQFNELRNNGEWPDSIQMVQPKTPRLKAPRPPQVYAELAYGALIAQNAARASLIFEEVQKYFDLLTIFQNIYLPALELLRQAWFHGEITIAMEHMAENYLKTKLLNLFHNLPGVKEGALVLVGCGPEDLREVRAIMFAILLRQHGFYVEYLGPDLQADEILDYAALVRPKIVCLTIKQENTAYNLRDFAVKLNNLRGRPKFGYSGSYITEHPEVRLTLGGIFLGETLAENVEHIKQLITIN